MSYCGYILAIGQVCLPRKKIFIKSFRFFVGHCIAIFRTTDCFSDHFSNECYTLDFLIFHCPQTKFVTII